MPDINAIEYANQQAKQAVFHTLRREFAGGEITISPYFNGYEKLAVITSNHRLAGEKVKLVVDLCWLLAFVPKIGADIDHMVIDNGPLRLVNCDNNVEFYWNDYEIHIGSVSKQELFDWVNECETKLEQMYLMFENDKTANYVLEHLVYDKEVNYDVFTKRMI